MIKVKSLFALRQVKTTTDIVYVETVSRLFRFEDGEWVERKYFTTEEVTAILGLKRDKLNRMILHLGIRRRMNRSENMSFEDVKLLGRVIKIRHKFPKKPFKQIKKELGI